MQKFINWNKIEDILPKKREYILIDTKYCKYPCIVGFYDGLNFRSAEDKSKIMNCEYWKEIDI